MYEKTQSSPVAMVLGVGCMINIHDGGEKRAVKPAENFLVWQRSETLPEDQ